MRIELSQDDLEEILQAQLGQKTWVFTWIQPGDNRFLHEPNETMVVACPIADDHKPL